VQHVARDRDGVLALARVRVRVRARAGVGVTVRVTVRVRVRVGERVTWRALAMVALTASTGALMEMSIPEVS